MPIRAYKKHFELANLDGLSSNNFLTRTHKCVSNNTSVVGKANYQTIFQCPYGAVRKPPNFIPSLYIQMDIVTACIFGYTFPAGLFFTVEAYVNIKKYIIEYLYNDS